MIMKITCSVCGKEYTIIQCGEKPRYKTKIKKQEKNKEQYTCRFCKEKAKIGGAIASYNETKI